MLAHRYREFVWYLLVHWCPKADMKPKGMNIYLNK